MKKKELSDKLNSVYKFTSDYINDNGFPPSVREICSKLNIKSTATAYSYIEKLRKKGLIDKSPMKKRALKLSRPVLSNQGQIPSSPARHRSFADSRDFLPFVFTSFLFKG